MATPAEIERKVRQLDNDVQSIYEMLATIEATQIGPRSVRHSIAASWLLQAPVCVVIVLFLLTLSGVPENPAEWGVDGLSERIGIEQQGH